MTLDDTHMASLSLYRVRSISTMGSLSIACPFLCSPSLDLTPLLDFFLQSPLLLFFLFCFVSFPSIHSPLHCHSGAIGQPAGWWGRQKAVSCMVTSTSHNGIIHFPQRHPVLSSRRHHPLPTAGRWRDGVDGPVSFTEHPRRRGGEGVIFMEGV